MIQFQCDYNEGAHPQILQRLLETNMEQTVGYGEDDFCAEAKKLIRQACENENVDVHFLVGGTQTNTTVIAHTLRPYQGVISAVTGHINVHETGAIEATGHKVLAIDSADGKLTALQIEDAVLSHLHEDGPEHMVQPGMVYISFPTEVGTIYTLSELQAISTVCRRYNLPLFVDGARLGYGLCSPDSDITLPKLATLTDVFYIGGTKCGTLFGEALVVTNRSLLQNLFSLVKQHGALLAKGRLLGIQFGVLFRDGLYERIGERAVQLALRIREAFRAEGYEVVKESPTNQQFFRLPNDVIDRLRETISFDYWGPRGATDSVVRFVTSWATSEEDVEALIAVLNKETVE